MKNSSTLEQSELIALNHMEEELTKIEREDLHEGEYHPARRSALELIGIIGGINVENMSLPDAIEEATNFPNKNAIRKAALVITRIAHRTNLLPEPTTANKLKIRVVKLVETGIPEIAQKCGLIPATQTFEKYECIARIHDYMCAKLDPLRQFYNEEHTVSQLLIKRADIIKAVSNDTLNSYLAMYDLKKIKTTLIQFLTDLNILSKTTDASFATKLSTLSRDVETELQASEKSKLFVIQKYYLIFLRALSNSLTQLGLEAKDRFACDLAPKRIGQDIAEKRYPLHESGRLIKPTIIFVNCGPGVARDVKANLICLSESAITDPPIDIEEIPPGDFPIKFDVLVAAPSKEIKFEIEVSWSITGQPERHVKNFPLKLNAQNSDVNWEFLTAAQPYSTDVAEGEDFVGRKIKVQAISGRFTKDRMGSSFITGQKRVGKTSLAKAIEKRIREHSDNLHIMYLEYGQYTSMSPVSTLANLGVEIFEFLQEHLAIENRPLNISFEGTLAPLTKIADVLARTSPEKKFIIILDEFDEIDPELYRFGALAEAFFSNLRTLSSKKNIAFLLVGGEKMPFVMSAQGDQLNKFMSERLDYFNRSEEWNDFLELVRKPVANFLNWSETAVLRVFELTNGHPYYAKLICAQASHKAITERDTEITEPDVRASMKILISALDSNSFAHLWKDGIPESDRQKSEVFELNRRRVLCACARTLRRKQHLTHENISENRSGLQIDSAHILVTLMDFVRRGVLSEQNSRYIFAIPLFQSWLEEVGTARLMADVLAEEYESKEQELEENARVTASELTLLTSKWGTYRGLSVGDEKTRAWLEQTKSHQEQRLLFKILKNLRFISNPEVRELLMQAHNMLAQFLPPFYQEKKSDRRRDLLITWIDGPGKSGNIFAGLYAEENRISTTLVSAPESVAKRLANPDESRPAAIIIVDDFIGTGNSLWTNLKPFVEEHSSAMMKFGVNF